MAIEERRSARAGWLLIDQIASSATNFLLAIMVARAATPSDFGAFSVASIILFAVLELSRPLALETLLVRFSGNLTAKFGSAVSGALTTAMLLGLSAGCFLGILGMLVGGGTSPFLVTLALALPAVLIQDACRFCLIAEGRVAAAAANDGLFLALAAIGTATVAVANIDGGVVTFLVWSASGLIAAGLGILQLGVRLDVRDAREWLAINRELWPRYVVEYILDAGGLQVTLLVVGLVGGLQAVGALNGARLLFGPIGILYLAASSVGLSEGARLRDTRSPSLVRALVFMSLLLTLIPLIWAAILLPLPDSIGAEVLGQTYEAAGPVLLPMALYWASRGALLGAKIAFRTSGHARTSLKIIASTAPMVVVTSILGAWYGGAVGAAYALAFSSLAAAFYSNLRIRSQFAPAVGGSR